MSEILIVSAAFIAIVLTIFVYFLYRLWGRYAKLKNIVSRIQKEVKILSETSTKFSLDEKEIDTITDVVVPRVLEYIKLSVNENYTDVSTIEDKTIPDIRFFRSKKGKVLMEEVTNERDAAFKVFNIKNNEAKFVYCGDIQNPDWFGAIVEFVNNPQEISNKTKIDTTTPGIVKINSNNNWEVITPAKIKFV
jgi:hypothetical protein